MIALSLGRVTPARTADHSPPPAAQAARLPMLDGLRGAAALAVAAYHFNLDGLIPVRIGHAYLAVDLFFLLSGFVVARAYEGRLRGGAGLGWFLRARMRRLYPIHLLGVALGGAACVAAALLHAPDRLGEVVRLTLMAALFLPLAGPGDRAAFPVNAPVWSLALELLANLAFGLIAPVLGGARLTLLVGISAVGLAWGTLANGGIPGPHEHDILLGGTRVGFGFFAGVGLHRLHAAGRLRAPRLPPALLFVALAALLGAPVEDPWRAPYDALCALLLMPPLVACAVAARPSPRAARLFAALARPSYALYALHTPVKAAALLAIGAGAPTLLGPLALAAAWPLSVLATRWLEPKARRRLGPGPLREGPGAFGQGHDAGGVALRVHGVGGAVAHAAHDPL